MPEENLYSQSISISGGKVQNVQIGGIAGRDMNANQTQQVGAASVSLKPEEVTALLGELEVLLKASDLPEDHKTKALKHIDTAKEEAQAAEPNRSFAAESLKHATTVLKEAGATVEAGTSLWDKVKPILETLSPLVQSGCGIFPLTGQDL